VPSLTRAVTGQIAFEGGVDGGRIPMLVSPANPTGLKFNQLSWLVNGTVRGGGILPRTGWFSLAGDFAGDDTIYQGGIVYQPDYGHPYIIFAAGGKVFRCNVQTDNSIQDITNGCVLSATATKFWFCQGEQFLIIQDGINEPLVWEDSILRKISDMPGAGPPATMLQIGEAMGYYRGRLWVAQGREYLAGDIVMGASGTALYGKRDAILHATENTYLAGGGKFIVPTVSGNIRAMSETANLDTALGEGQLFIFTRNTIYAVDVPSKRTDWVALSEPIQRVAQLRYGAVSDRSIVKVNGDLFYQSYDGVRSLFTAVRQFQNQWGQTALSRSENRILQFNDRAFASFSSGIEFDNRLLETALPIQTPVGVASQAILPLDFDLITSLSEKLPPVWEGHWEGLDVLQLLEGDWGGLQRAFAFIHSRVSHRIELWELSQARKFEADDVRNTMVIEFPAYHYDDPMQLRELDNAELWIDRMNGTVDFRLFYRQDQNPCWIEWHAWSECSARNTCEDVVNPICYPEQGYRSHCDEYRITINIPRAPAANDCDLGNGRPSNFGFTFQPKLEVHGWCRVRGLFLWSIKHDRPAYENLRNT